jgi:hypothetical protein
VKEKREYPKVGDRWHRLTFVSVAIEHKYKTRSKLVWQCDCGNTTTIQYGEVLYGNRASCGCARRSHANGGRALFGKGLLPRITKSRFSVFRHTAKKRGFHNELSYEQWAKLMFSDCVYCGDPATGVDRIVSALGYTLTNSAPACERCNKMKMAHAPQDWYRHIEKVLEHTRKLDPRPFVFEEKTP